mmetsp:Transcript_22636/g.57698  ORF Transcript_22636/g.57698 Transcript_22636/m.57698 type:complete len:158 (+) Transcript_22636:327-800(+)
MHDTLHITPPGCRGTIVKRKREEQAKQDGGEVKRLKAEVKKLQSEIDTLRKEQRKVPVSVDPASIGTSSALDEEARKCEERMKQIRERRKYLHRKEKGEIEQSKQCSVCFENESSTVLLPCGHLCVCEICAQKLLEERPTCPICRKHIEGMNRVYQV